MKEFSLAALADIIAVRASESADVSYTKSLLESGAQKIAKKFGEESIELAIALVCGDKSAIKSEAADVMFHLLVALESSGVTLQDVILELGARTGKTGHQEKASRKK